MNSSAQPPIEHKKFFQYFFLYRALTLFLSLWVIVGAGQRDSFESKLAVWSLVLLYTAAIYIKRFDLLALALKHPIFSGLDLLVCLLLSTVYIAWDSPFYQYTMSPIIPATFFYRLKGAAYTSITLSLGQIVSVLLHGATVQDMLEERHFQELAGHIAGYLILACMCVYPANLIAKIIQQREVIKKQTEQEAVFEERARLAREFHDSLAQMLAAVKLKTEMLHGKLGDNQTAILEDVRQLSLTALQDLRSEIFALRPENIKLSLGQMINAYCRRISSTTDCQIKSHVNTDRFDLPVEQKYEILRIVQEAIANAIRHSKADSVHVQVTEVDSSLTIKIEDYGTGFNSSETQQGSGLSEMRGRANSLKGSLIISSAQGKGTKVELVLPVRS